MQANETAGVTILSNASGQKNYESIVREAWPDGLRV